MNKKKLEGKKAEEQRKDLTRARRVVAFFLVQLVDYFLVSLTTHKESCAVVVDGETVLANYYLRILLYAVLGGLWLWSLIVVIGRPKEKKKEEKIPMTDSPSD